MSGYLLAQSAACPAVHHDPSFGKVAAILALSLVLLVLIGLLSWVVWRPLGRLS